VSERPRSQPIEWYWVPIEPQALAGLCRKSDSLAALQTIGFLSILVFTGSLAYYSSGHWPWYVTVVLLFLHGTCWGIPEQRLSRILSRHGLRHALPEPVLSVPRQLSELE
jgi:hypothetical protein